MGSWIWGEGAGVPSTPDRDVWRGAGEGAVFPWKRSHPGPAPPAPLHHLPLPRRKRVPGLGRRRGWRSDRGALPVLSCGVWAWAGAAPRELYPHFNSISLARGPPARDSHGPAHSCRVAPKGVAPQTPGSSGPPSRTAVGRRGAPIAHLHPRPGRGPPAPAVRRRPLPPSRSRGRSGSARTCVSWRLRGWRRTPAPSPLPPGGRQPRCPSVDPIAGPPPCDRSAPRPGQG
jgi:hypothetical protein